MEINQFSYRAYVREGWIKLKYIYICGFRTLGLHVNVGCGSGLIWPMHFIPSFILFEKHWAIRSLKLGRIYSITGFKWSRPSIVSSERDRLKDDAACVSQLIPYLILSFACNGSWEFLSLSDQTSTGRKKDLIPWFLFHVCVKQISLIGTFSIKPIGQRIGQNDLFVKWPKLRSFIVVKIINLGSYLSYSENSGILLNSLLLKYNLGWGSNIRISELLTRRFQLNCRLPIKVGSLIGRATWLLSKVELKFRPVFKPAREEEESHTPKPIWGGGEKRTTLIWDF
jgi:hypothetical protein